MSLLSYSFTKKGYKIYFPITRKFYTSMDVTIRIEPLKAWHEHSCLHLLHFMWFRCIKSCMEDLSHEFLANRWLVHYWFMGLSNPLEVVVHHLLIGEMVSLGHPNGFPMVSTLVYMVTHWTRPMMSYDLKISSSHDLIKLFHCVVSQP